MEQKSVNKFSKIWVYVVVDFYFQLMYSNVCTKTKETKI